MPQWLINLLLKLAVSWGLPALAKAFPWLPKEVIDLIVAIIEGLKKSEQPVETLREVKRAVSQCNGIACAPDLLHDR